MSLLDLFCAVDDFCRRWEPTWQRQQLARGLRRRQRTRQLCLSEIMTNPDCLSLFRLPELQDLLG